MRLITWILLGTTLVTASGLFGCAANSWQHRVISQASFDHRCPEEQVTILRDNGDGMARAVELQVCGQTRMYRDVGGSQVYLYRDVTEQQSWGGSGSP